MYYDKFKAEHMGSLDMKSIMAKVEAIKTEVPEEDPEINDRESWAYRQFQAIVKKYF